MSQPTTKLAQRLDEVERSASWLARKMGVSHQAAGNWVTGRERCPPGRQAQIAIHLEVKASALFKDGWAVGTDA